MVYWLVFGICFFYGLVYYQGPVWEQLGCQGGAVGEVTRTGATWTLG